MRNLLALVATATLLAACMPSPESPRGFRLPDGDPQAGEATFVRLNCHGCHQVVGVEFPEFDYMGPPLVDVVLGGETTRVRTYGELVTSIINPSHRIARMYDESRVTPEGESRMANYNEVLTVQELIDLVAFLQAQYEIVPPAYE